MIETTHACPRSGDGGLTPCCGRSPFELPMTHRVTLDPELVNCTVRRSLTSDERASYQSAVARGTPPGAALSDALDGVSVDDVRARGGGATSGGTEMSENLRDGMERALKEAWRDRAMSVSFDVTWRAVTDAAWEVVGPELDRLRAEVERQARLLDSAYRFGDERGSDLLALSAEHDDLRARLVALADEADRTPNHFGETGYVFTSRLRALASVPEPSDSEPKRIVDCLCGHALYRHGKYGIGGECRIIGCGCFRYVPQPAPDADREAGGE